ncbi:MAG TPA: SpoIIE family protein phosphatase [Mycobacteriales bacterium]|nr:SpoIIE family protein phosphatase [Mycobacteriales bacterium]
MSRFLRWVMPSRHGQSSRAQYGAQLAAVGGCYYLAAWLSLRISLVGGVVTPIWPPTGIAVVALMILGLRVWPAVTLAALAVNLPINDSAGSALLIAVGNTAAPFLAVWLLRRGGFRWRLDRLRDALALVLLGALAAMVVSATLGTTALLLDETIKRGGAGSTWALWWAGDGTGVLVFAPLLFTLHRLRRLTWLGAVELAGVIGGLAAIGYVVFRSQAQDTYLVFPLLIWAAVRFRQAGAALGAVTIVGMATWAAYDQVGPFANVTFLHRVLTLQVYNAVAALTSFVLAAVIAERANALRELKAGLDREQGITEALQRSLLPERLPAIPGVEFASRYTPGGAGLQVGGDWYDVIELPRGCIGLTVGDVVGRGINAAAAMGQLRTAIRAYALENPSPAAVLEQMSRVVVQVEAGQMATLVYAVLDPGSETLTYASAGHPPPLLVGTDGSATYLEGGRSLPLGLTSAPRIEAVTTIEPGSTLILYTDGLIERRGQSIDDGLEALRHAAESGAGAIDAVCSDRLLAAAHLEPGDDDIAVLATRLLPISSNLHLSLPAEPGQVAAVRRALRSWVVHWGATAREADDLVHAASEAASNVVEHAYGAAGGELTVHAIHDAGFVSVTVRDRGRWRPARDVGQGRGLELIRSLVDDVDVVRAAEGTEVRMHFVLGRVAREGRAIHPSTAGSPEDTADLIEVIPLYGEIDLANATTRYHEIITQVRPHAIGLVLDLTEVDHIDSAGVRLLFRVATRIAPRRQSFCVVTTPDSAVDRILRLCGYTEHSRVAPTVAAAKAELLASSS